MFKQNFRQDKMLTFLPETETIDMKEELTKLEDEINTLKQVINLGTFNFLYFCSVKVILR